MTIESRLAEIRARVEAATEGPWRVDYDNADDWEAGIAAGDYPEAIVGPRNIVHEKASDGFRRLLEDKYATANIVNEICELTTSDATFIAASRTDLPALLAAVQAVMDLHKCLTFPDDGIGEPTACGHCDNETWPCPTVQDIAAALEVEG